MDDAVRDEPGDDESIASLFSRVLADAQQVARAEIELQKAKIVARVQDARNGVLLLLAAAATGSLAIVALVIGMLMVLASLVGPGWATVIVVGSLLLMSALLGWLGIRHFKLLFAASEKLP